MNGFHAYPALASRETGNASKDLGDVIHAIALQQNKYGGRAHPKIGFFNNNPFTYGAFRKEEWSVIFWEVKKGLTSSDTVYEIKY